MKSKKNSFIQILSGLFIFASLVIARTPVVHADSLTVNIGVTGECVSTVNGSSNSSANITSGSLTLTIQNADIFVGQKISGDNVNSTIEKGTSTTASTTTLTLESVTTQTVITFTPIPADGTSSGVDNFCPTESTPVPSTLTLKPSASTTTPGNTTEDKQSQEKDKEKTTPKDDKDKNDENKSDLKKESSSNNESLAPEKSNSKVLIIFIISGVVLLIGILIYIFKIKKIKFRSFKDISRR